MTETMNLQLLINLTEMDFYVWKLCLEEKMQTYKKNTCWTIVYIWIVELSRDFFPEETKTRIVPGKVLVTLQKGHVGFKTEEYSHLLNTGSNKIGS